VTQPATVAPKRVGIVGLGPIGRTVAHALAEGIPGYRLSALCARRPDRAAEFSRTLSEPVPVLGLDQMQARSDVLVECAPAAIFDAVARPMVEAGKHLVVLSAGALLNHWELVELAGRTGASIAVPSGAIVGLDAVQAAAQGEVTSVLMTTRKPVSGLLGAPHLRGREDELRALTEPLLLFEGTARQAAAGFPANLNVAVALALAGVGPDRTRLAIWADPALTRNTHHIEVVSDSARLRMSIENIPSENPKTGRITALSVLAHLRKATATLRVGT
jgi:aspartate dehydrogenase